jgi:hypothetical protein
MKKKDERKRDSRKPVWLPADTDRVTYRLLTSEDDPLYAVHTMTTTVRSAPCRSKPGLKW